MSQNLLASAAYEPRSSPRRLLNLALGCSAVMSFAGAIGGPSWLAPGRWILAPWFSPASLETVPGAIKFMTKIGINLWLPASVLLLLFVLLGFHRKLDAPRPKRAALGLALAWIAYIALTAFSFVLDAQVGGSDAAGAVGLIAGLLMLPIVGILGACALLAAVAEIKTMWTFEEVTRPRLPVSLAAWAAIPPVLLIMPLWFAPSQPRALTARVNDEFEELCRTVGVRLLAKAAGPVRSIAYDWDRERMNRPFPCYVLDERGNFSSGNLTCWAPFIIYKDGQELVLDFIESRQDNYCSAISEVRMPYAHCPSMRADVKLKLPRYAIDTFTADVLAYYEVDRPDSKINNLHHGPVRFQITLTDRQSGDVLGEMAYVVDQGNRRACGGNMGNEINQDAFIWDAIHRQ